jgi:hypothetical protein
MTSMMRLARNRVEVRCKPGDGNLCRINSVQEQIVLGSILIILPRIHTQNFTMRFYRWWVFLTLIIEYNGTTGISTVNSETISASICPNPSMEILPVHSKGNFQNAIVIISDMIESNLKRKHFQTVTNL